MTIKSTRRMQQTCGLNQTGPEGPVFPTEVLAGLMRSG